MNQYVNITKKIALIIVLSCFVAYSTFAQDTIEQINCSGVLQENGQLLTGSKDLTFSIEDSEWSQTIPEVLIQNGIYSVKLNAPPSVFWSLQSENKQANLEISIDGSPLSPKTTMLWVPYAYLAKRAIDTLKIAGNPVTGTPQTNYVLKWNGSEWVPAPDATGDSGIATETDPIWSKASSGYYEITDLKTSGNAQIHWNNIDNVPADIKDGDNVGITSLSTHNATELKDLQSSGSGSIITTEERNKLNDIEAEADKTDAQNVASAGAIMDGDFSSNGIMKRTGSGSYGVLDATTGRTFLGLGSAATRQAEDTVTNGNNLPDGAAIIAHTSKFVMDADFSSNGFLKRTGDGTYSVIEDKSSNWNKAFDEKNTWDGSSSKLNAATGRTSLGLGSAATRQAEDTVTNGNNLPDGAAIIAHTSKFVMDSDFTSNGIMKRTNEGTYSIINDNSTNWNKAYDERKYWDGSSSNLNATTGRTSLGLGSAATRNAEDSVSNGSNLPDGAAIVSYVASQIPNTSNFVTISGNQTITGQKVFDSYATFNETTKYGNTSDNGRIEIYSDSDDGITFYTKSGSKIGEIGIDTTLDGLKNWVFDPGSGVERIRFGDDIYIGWPSADGSNGHSGNGELYVQNEIHAFSELIFYRYNSMGTPQWTETGQIFGNGDGISIWPEDPNGYGTNIRGLVATSNGNDVYLRLGNYISFSEGASWSGDLNIALGDSKNKRLKVEGYFEVTQSAYKPGGGSWSSSSDARLKDIKNNFDRGLDEIESINTVVYSYKKDNPLGLPSEREYVGVIAQEVQKVIPEAIEKDENDENGYLAVNNDPIIWTMLNSIKQLSSQNKDLKAENETLKQELSQIKQMIAKIQQSLEITQ